MNGQQNRGVKESDRIRFLLIFLVSLILFPSSARCEEIYRFERLWPTLQQPWFFYHPWGIAVDSHGYAYVADTSNCCIHKYTLEGRFVQKWGKEGSGDGEFEMPIGLAVDADGNVYVSDLGSNTIQKFTAEGQFLLKWGKKGTGPGEFNQPLGLAIDAAGDVFVTDARNDRVQKFTAKGRYLTEWYGDASDGGLLDYPVGIAIDRVGNIYVSCWHDALVRKFNPNGKLLTWWGGEGEDDGLFILPSGIAVDRAGNVLVVDYGYIDGGQRVQKFAPNGRFLSRWGGPGMSDGRFARPFGIAVDSIGTVYVVDSLSDRVQKFTAKGVYITKWAVSGDNPGEFFWPASIAKGPNGVLYVADFNNNRIQKFNAKGRFLTEWHGNLFKGGELMLPSGVAVGPDGSVYVSEYFHHRIRKFTPEGEHITKWGGKGNGDGQFFNPYHLVVDGQGNVYVTDTGNQRIQKFTADGTFVTKWGSLGSGDGQFGGDPDGSLGPAGIAVDRAGNVYVADTGNNRIQKFTPEGEFIAKYGSYGSGEGQFSDPIGLAVDDSGNLYVADSLNCRIQKFDSNGKFVTAWSNKGIGAGQVVGPVDIEIGEDGAFYVADFTNNRIQMFRQVTLESRNKAIVVAGGGPYEGNHLWEATQMCANFAFRTLTYQGFTKESIYYLSSDTKLDMDGNGVRDEVDGDATVANLKRAITGWAKGADNVLVYLTDHGGEGLFRMSGKETLSARDLASWLDALESSITGRVIVIYDACQSGSFLSTLASSSGKGRIVITSTSPGEDAYFVNQGSISFSNYLWTQIFNGLDLGSGFRLAKEAIGDTTDYQHPLLDADGNGVPNETSDYDLAKSVFIGNGTDTFSKAPKIAEVSLDQTITATTQCSFYADGVTDKNGIARVWAVVRPPDFKPAADGNPVSELPSFDLMPKGAGRYEGTYNGFNLSGTYQVALYATDRIGNTSVPKLTTVSVNSPLTRKAIIVAGGTRSDPLWPAIEKSAIEAYSALTYQQYSEEAILFLSPVTVPGVDGLASLGSLREAIQVWAKENTQDVVLYLIGPADAEGFRIGPSQILSAEMLDGWLDSLQATLSGKVTVIAEGSFSGNFLPLLTAPKGRERILISSTAPDQPACFLSDGDVSFSQFFWYQVANGVNIRDSFLGAKNAIRYACQEQTPNLDDNGNGVANEKSDGQLAESTTIGVGIVLAGDAPVIGSICPRQTLYGEASAAIWVKDITATSPVAKVWAVINRSGDRAKNSDGASADDRVLELQDKGNGRFEGVWDHFALPGFYSVTVFALDRKGNVSLPKTGWVFQSLGPDLVMPALSGPLAAKASSSILVKDTVLNQGATGSGPFTIGIYLSKNSKIDRERDRLIQSQKISSLDAGESREGTVRIALPADLEPGTYYLGAIVDPERSVPETREANNSVTAQDPLTIQ